MIATFRNQRRYDHRLKVLVNLVTENLVSRLLFLRLAGMPTSAVACVENSTGRVKLRKDSSKFNTRGFAGFGLGSDQIFRERRVTHVEKLVLFI